MVGFTSTTFRHLSPEQIIRLAAAAGAECVEWSGPHAARAEPEEILKRCSDCGIEISSLGSYYRIGRGGAAEKEKLLDTAGRLGAKVIRVWLGVRGSAETGEREFDDLLEDAGILCDLAEKRGVVIAAEAHRNTYNDSAEASLKFLNAINRPGFRTYFQSTYKDMETDLDRLEKTYEFTQNVHVSYSEALRNRIFMKPDGSCVDRIVDRYKQKGFKGNILLEYVTLFSRYSFYREYKRLKDYYYYK
jgi:Sugar phosphate isomerases/epimerases